MAARTIGRRPVFPIGRARLANGARTSGVLPLPQDRQVRELLELAVDLGEHGEDVGPSRLRSPTRPLAEPTRYPRRPVPRVVVHAGTVRERGPVWSRSVPTWLQFTAPSRVMECVRRVARREAMFAFGLAGFRGSAPGRARRNGKKYRRTQSSLWRC